MSDDLIKQMHALIESEMSYEDIYGEYIKRIKDIKKLYLDLIETIKNSWNIVMNDNRIKTLRS